MTRRTLLVLLGGLATSSVVGCGLGGATHPLVAGRKHLDAAVALGEEWLSTLDRKPAVDELLVIALGPKHAASTDGELFKVLSQRVRNDFRGGRVGWLQGWMLAEAELAVYALAALQHRGFG